MNHLEQTLTAATTIIALLILFWSQIKGIFTGFYKTTYGAVVFFKTSGMITQRVDEIHKEVKPNSGTSLRDEIRRIEGMVSRGTARDEARFNLDEEPQWETNEKGEIVKVNRCFADLVGRSPEDVHGQNWKNTIHPSDLTDVVREWASVVADKRDSVIYYRVQRPDGRDIQVVARGEMMTNSQGEVLGWYGTLRPVPPQLVEKPLEIAKKPRVLMVEDSSDTSGAFQLLLNPYFDIRIASSGRDAIQQFSDAQSAGHPFEAILMDQSMPDMNGLQTLAKIRDRENVRNHTKVVFVTGVKDEITLADRERLKIADVIEKPVGPLDVAARVLALLKESI